MTKIFKLTGAGNNFLILDLRAQGSSKKIKKSRAEVARILCDPFTSIGADGLVFLEKSKVADLKWDFFNADGSRAEMCGNAARCVGRYEIEQNKITRTLTLETLAGTIQLSPKSRGYHKVTDIVPVVVEMPSIKSYLPHQKFLLGHKKYTFDYINSGVPHAVFVPRMKIISEMIKNVDNLGSIVNNTRALTQFKQNGVNVTFFVKISKNLIHSLTFERGVRGFTQACGTGAVAAAASFLSGHPGAVTVKVPGGLLKVDLNGHRPLLTGPTKFIAEIECYENL